MFICEYIVTALREKRGVLGGTLFENLVRSSVWTLELFFIMCGKDVFIAFFSLKSSHLLKTSGRLFIQVMMGRNLGMCSFQFHRGLCTFRVPYICGIRYFARQLVLRAFLK